MANETTQTITAGTIYDHQHLGRVTAMLSGVDPSDYATVHVHDLDDTGQVAAGDLTPVAS